MTVGVCGEKDRRSRVGESSASRDFYCGGVINTLTPRTFVDRIRFDRASLSTNGFPVVVVDCTTTKDSQILAGVDRDQLADLPVVMIGWGVRSDFPGASAAIFDVVIDDQALVAAVLDMVSQRPLAAVTTALLLRRVDERSVEDSLVVESTTYSLLQSGPEFRQWQTARQSSPSNSRQANTSEIVIVDRVADDLVVTLNRPERRNAYSSLMRSALADALEVAVLDSSVQSVTLQGAGHNFSSGGDLDEFGTFSDPVTAHLNRLSSRVTRSLWSLRQRLGAELRCIVQGQNFGAGVELAAFAGHVSASFDATFTLPEVRMGLLPGSGGTASLPLRIGRHKTLLLALTGLPIDAATACDWGLVDVVVG